MNIKLTYISFCICVLLLLPVRIAAQVCNPNFTVNTEITNSTCQSNGEIRVTLSGDNIADLINVQYGLTSTTPGGFSIEPRTDPVLKNIPPGTYDLTVRAFCKNDSDYDVVKKAMGLVVGGNYTVPVATFNASTSRKSYDTCGTGKIALNVTGGNGTFTFTITSAPAGVTLGTVTPTKSGNVYTFPGENYPAGNYSIQVSDACYSAACSFTLEGISGFPAVSTGNTRFYPTLIDNDCDRLLWSPGSVSSTTQADYYRYYSEGMYEVGIAPPNQLPTTWTVWNSSSNISLNIAPYSYEELYGTTGKLYIYTRVKGCPDLYTSVAASFKVPRLTSSATRYCDYCSYTVRPWTDYDGMICYPLSVIIKETGSGNTILEKNNVSHSASQTVQLQYGTAYRASFTDANGYELTSLNVIPTRGTFSFSYSEDVCNNQFRVTYSTTERCYPVDITIKTSDGLRTVHTNTLTSATSGSCYLDYGESYTFSAVYRDTNPLRTYSTTISRTTTLPTAYSLTLYDISSCKEERGRLHISRSNGTGVSGTTYSVVGPPGYTPQSGTFTSSISLGETYLPIGTYTATIVNGCGSQTQITATYNHLGGYSGKNLSYTTETICDGMEVTPSGYITYRNVEQTSSTYYRLTDGPTGFSKDVKKPGQSFMLNTPGTYILGITTANSTSGCAIATDTIEYAAPQLALDANTTSAYVCVGGSVGNISIKAINGVAPYIYELWNEANTTKLAADVTTSGTAYFPYGSVNETYTVRITDGCGNSFNQQITVADMKTARIVYSAEPEVCNGDTISLNCITLGTTAYSWTGPNGFASTEQNPIIANAQENMSGWYRVSVTPEYCGMAVEDSVLITVYPPLTAGVSVGNQTTCVRTTPSVLSSETTGGKGAYAYQWQSSADAVTWADIPNATQATYQPPVQSYAGLFYYRRTSADDCHTVYSTPVKVKVKACYIPVNPHIRHMK